MASDDLLELRRDVVEARVRSSEMRETSPAAIKDLVAYEEALIRYGKELCRRHNLPLDCIRLEIS